MAKRMECNSDDQLVHVVKQKLMEAFDGKTFNKLVAQLNDKYA